MEITKTVDATVVVGPNMTVTVPVDVTVEVDVNDVIDEIDPLEILDLLSSGELKKYLVRRKVGISEEQLTDEQIKYAFTQLCIGRCPRNMEFDKATIRSTILQLLDSVL